jgi:HTH-like domain
VHNGTLRYRSTRDRQDALRQRSRELAAVRVRFGYRRLTVLLKREGGRVNAKRIYRLYVDEGLTVRTKPRKRLASRARCRCRHRRNRTSAGRWTSSARGSSMVGGFERSRCSTSTPARRSPSWRTGR